MPTVRLWTRSARRKPPSRRAPNGGTAPTKGNHEKPHKPVQPAETRGPINVGPQHTDGPETPQQDWQAACGGKHFTLERPQIHRCQRNDEPQRNENSGRAG